jgi:threonine/homoserine/homoserine lactone efflux protein
MEVSLIEPTKFILFVSVSWALIIAPGPDMIYVITRGVTQGRRAGLLSAVGVFVEFWFIRPQLHLG